ncbi:MAG: hypothetical protein LKK18_07675 [Clostridiales bacterium]|nr:hypothetical protein [Clostridiales bacterium]
MSFSRLTDLAAMRDRDTQGAACSGAWIFRVRVFVNGRHVQRAVPSVP